MKITMTMLRTLIILITALTLSSSGTCQMTLTPWTTSGEKDTTSSINAHQAFLISATFKRMIYLDAKVESLLKYSAIDKQKISEYKEVISIQDNSIQQLNKSLQETQKLLVDEENKKKMWRRLCLIPSGIIIGVIALSL